MRLRVKLCLWIFLGIICIGGMISDLTLNTSAKTEEQDENTVVQENLEGQEYRPGNEGAAEEDLFDSYLENTNEDGVQVKIKKYAGNKLQGINRGIYNVLMEYIKQVAAGDRASTKFEVDIDSLGEYNRRWSASDLGVDSIVDEEGISEEALSAFKEKANCDLQLIVTALMADNPYGLYWYDKTAETQSSPIYIRAEFDETLDEYLIGYRGKITITFPVAAEYADGEYSVNTEIGKSVSTIVEMAHAIVSEYSGMSDYEKLDGYRKEICDLVSYNHSVANESAYGNPWQIIWVFDEDENTNVVCEGYSKAFHYLCDLTDFTGNIECITVSGAMWGGNGEGSHMWNIVTMEDGNNYLVDVTNCDAGTIGAPSELFLAGMNNTDEAYYIDIKEKRVWYRYDEDMMTIYDSSDLAIAAVSYLKSKEHIHSWSSWMPADAASHQRICDFDETHIETEAHVWDDGEITTEPSGTAPGVRTFTCSVCGMTRREEIPATVDDQDVQDEQDVQEKSGTIRVSRIMLTSISHNIAAGKSIRLTAAVLPKDASNKKVKWTTSDSRVAVVSQTGKVTVRKKTGGKSAIIKAHAVDGSGKYAAWKIKSMKGIVKAVKISGKKTVKAGKTLKLKAIVKATKGAGKTIQWTTGNKKYATVSSRGVVKALKAGKGRTVRITASATDGSGKKKTISIRIK